MGIPPELLEGLASGSPYIILVTVLVLIVIGILAPKWVIDDLKDQLQEKKDAITKAIDNYENINDQLRQNNTVLDRVDRQYEQINSTLRDLLRDRRS